MEKMNAHLVASLSRGALYGITPTIQATGSQVIFGVREEGL